MSQENIERVHEVIDAFNRRDLGAYLALTDPDVEFTPYEAALQGGEPYRGHAGVRTWWEEAFAVLPDLKVEIKEAQDLQDMTFVHGRGRGQGAGSGVPVEMAMWLAVRWRDGRVVWWYGFASESEALEAVGLAE